MTYQLYNRDGSGGFVVEAVLALAQVPFELVKLPSRPGTPLPETFRETNPWGQVPVLITPEGDRLTESAAIVIHLAACYPDKNLAPTPGSRDHAIFLRWMVFMSANLYESVLRAGYPSRYTTDPEGSPAVSEAAKRRLKDGLRLIDDAIEEGSYPLGESISAADIYLVMFHAWYSHSGEVRFPAIEALGRKVAGHRVVGPIWQRHFADIAIAQV